MGLKALVLGGAGLAVFKVAKGGLLVKILAVGWKGILVVFAGIGAFFKKIFGRGGIEDTAAARRSAKRRLKARRSGVNSSSVAIGAPVRVGAADDQHLIVRQRDRRAPVRGTASVARRDRLRASSRHRSRPRR